MKVWFQHKKSDEAEAKYQAAMQLPKLQSRNMIIGNKRCRKGRQSLPLPAW